MTEEVIELKKEEEFWKEVVDEQTAQVSDACKTIGGIKATENAAGSKGKQIWVPENLRARISSLRHTEKLASYLGQRKILEIL